ncbi:PTS sugar transporter subunit IIA [candidate division KSB1 bacterium]|nr:PTS sugar transporter subunit IIA [candidate division KSB1 bacterium]
MEKQELIQFFNPHLFVPALAADTKEQALVELTAQFYENKYVKNQDILLAMLNQRESLGSTAIGKGIAIPHGRSTAVKDVVIAFGKTGKGIEFGAEDGKPVHLIFVVVAPPVEQTNKYLPILGKLVETLNNTKNRKKLMGIATFEDLKNFFSEV